MYGNTSNQLTFSSLHSHITTLELKVEQFGEALVVVEAEAVVVGRHRRLQRKERLQLQWFWNVNNKYI